MPLMKSVRQANQVFYMHNGYYTNDFTAWDIDMPPGATRTGAEQGAATIVIPGGIHLNLVSAAVEGASLPRVQGTISGVPATLHVFYESGQWKCYPRGTDMGWRLCKALGCTTRPPTSGAGCNFTL